LLDNTTPAALNTEWSDFKVATDISTGGSEDIDFGDFIDADQKHEIRNKKVVSGNHQHSKSVQPPHHQQTEEDEFGEFIENCHRPVVQDYESRIPNYDALSHLARRVHPSMHCHASGTSCKRPVNMNAVFSGGPFEL
jgi:hypothetical protein